MKQLKSVKNGQRVIFAGKEWEVNCKWKNQFGHFVRLIRVFKSDFSRTIFETKVVESSVLV